MSADFQIQYYYLYANGVDKYIDQNIAFYFI